MNLEKENQETTTPVNIDTHPYTSPTDIAYKWQDAIHIVRLMQSDYCQAKRQLEEIYRSFNERETRSGERIRHLLRDIEDVRAKPDGKSSARNDTALVPGYSIRAYCLGNFEVYLNWDRIDNWHSLKAKSLFKYLLIHRKNPLNKDILVETLWPNCDPEVGRNNLKAAIYSLRKTLLSRVQTDEASRLILHSEGQYSLNPQLQIWIDADEFEHCWLKGRDLERKGMKEEASKEFHLAEELYRGDYFEDDPYAEWTLLPREALKDIYLGILGKLAYRSFENVDYESCLVYSQRILSKDICHEEAYRWIMHCYSRLGQYHRAHQWYNVCASTLNKELNIKPEKKTQDLHRRLMQHEAI